MSARCGASRTVAVGARVLQVGELGGSSVPLANTVCTTKDLLQFIKAIYVLYILLAI